MAKERIHVALTALRKRAEKAERTTAPLSSHRAHEITESRVRLWLAGREAGLRDARRKKSKR